MAHLWYWTKEDNSGGAWTVVPLEAGAYRLSQKGLRAVEGDHNDQPSPAVLLVRRCVGRIAEWILLARVHANVCVNGRPLALGFRCLTDRDEIAFMDASVAEEAVRLFFSTERLPRSETFQQSNDPIHCARCRQEISDGETVVCCPECGVFHHASSHLPCWGYSPACTCGYPTAPDGNYRWSPEGL